jgi:lipocalin-like protein
MHRSKENRKAPAGADPTDAERAELLKTMGAFSGTYKVEGNKIIFHYEASWIQSRTGTDETRTFETSGGKLMVSYGPIKSGLDGKQVVNTWTLERIE